MGKKCLIMYASFTGNTEKVAKRFKETFESQGWQCDLFKVKMGTDEILSAPFDIHQYDFMCVGSGSWGHLPYRELLNMLSGFMWGFGPRRKRSSDDLMAFLNTPIPQNNSTAKYTHRKIVLGPDSPKAVTFITYGGYEFGAKEALPAMQLLALEIEHLGFQCIGSFCCPGKYLNDPTPRTFHGDIRDRPNEKDLLKAQMFIEEKLEEIADRT